MSSFAGAVAQLGEHLVCNQGVGSSNLLSSTKLSTWPNPIEAVILSEAKDLLFRI